MRIRFNTPSPAFKSGWKEKRNRLQLDTSKRKLPEYYPHVYEHIFCWRNPDLKDSINKSNLEGNK